MRSQVMTCLKRHDKSRGAHNFDYASSLLENAIAYLTANGSQASNFRKQR